MGVRLRTNGTRDVRGQPTISHAPTGNDSAHEDNAAVICRFESLTYDRKSDARGAVESHYGTGGGGRSAVTPRCVVWQKARPGPIANGGADGRKDGHSVEKCFLTYRVWLHFVLEYRVVVGRTRMAGAVAPIGLGRGVP